MDSRDLAKKTLEAVKDIHQRHKERHSTSGFYFAIADRISLLIDEHWQQVVEGQTLFLSIPYLKLLEAYCPKNTILRFALIYRDETPVAALAVQIVDIAFNQVVEESKEKDLMNKALSHVQSRMLVCGNLISSGLHGVAFSPGSEPKELWPAVAEALYRIRRGEKLSGQTDLVMLKDFKGSAYESSQTLSRYSYRPIKCDPDMVLSLPEDCNSFDDYLGSLKSSYRKNAQRVIRRIEDAGYRTESLEEVSMHDADLHRMYLEVENRADVRLASIAPGYFRRSL